MHLPGLDTKVLDKGASALERMADALERIAFELEDARHRDEQDRANRRASSRVPM